MEKEDRETMGHISETLDSILAVLVKPQTKVMRILEIVTTGIALFGIISVIDIVKSWIGG